MKPWTLAVCLAALPGAALAQPDQPPKPQAERRLKAPPPARTPPASGLNYRVSFAIQVGELEAKGNFVVHDGAQSNYVVGGDAPFEVANGRGDSAVEFKKHGTIVNCLPAADPNHRGRVMLQCQFELSGPTPPSPGLQARGVETFQYQSEFAVTLGRELVLVDEPERRLSVRVDEAKEGPAAEPKAEEPEPRPDAQ